jgi:PAS domain S-box-containing protein
MSISQETGVAERQAPFPLLPEAVRGSRVLVVDDNPANVLLLQRLLRAAGLANVDGYTDPRAALERCLESVPDLLLLDLHMPPPDGFQVMEALGSRLPPDVFLPVLVLTADAGGEIKRQALAAGAKDFLTKPLDNVEVVLRVRNLLETQQLMRHLRRREREEAAAVLVQQSSDVITVVDSDLVIRFQTPSAESVLGYGPDALIGVTLTDLVTPTQRASAEEHYAQVANAPGAGPPVEWDLRRADGSCIPVHAVSNNLLDDPRVDGIVVTIRDISDQKAFEEGLKRQVEELRELDRMQHELVSTVSHELRTPLTCILGLTELLADGGVGPISAEQAHVVGVIDRNSHRLLALIEDLLTIGHVESRGLDLDLGPVDVAALVDELTESVLPTVTARSQTLTVDVDPQAGEIVADGSLLERALSNLLSNAVKFTPEGGTVTLSVKRTGAEMAFSVTDTGIGISRADQKRLFTRFFRSAVATVNAIPGTGLGLSIVKQIVDAHRGSITLTSVPDQGTTVVFTLPTERTA